MSEIMLVQPVTAARCSMNVRSATTADLPFIDGLQKMHTHMVGWMPFKSLEGHLAKGRILIAEQDRDEETKSRRDGVEGGADPLRLSVSPSLCLSPEPIGYVLSADQYMKRDDVGIVYQLNVAPHRQRSLVGAMLIRAVFERAAYGCRLFCCWCAQDIQANYFWQSIGFVPLAFRTGSRAKQRIHIFWQRRVREGDDSTPYWFPSQTTGGAVGEDRIVLPIPLGTHWRDAKPLVLPGQPEVPPPLPSMSEEGRMLPGGALVKARPAQPKLTAAQKAAVHRVSSKHLGGVPLGKKAVLRGGRVCYVERTDFVMEELTEDTPFELQALAVASGAKPPPKTKKTRTSSQRAKNDPTYTAAARELRDRYLEHVNRDPFALLSGENAKYEVGRAPRLEAADAPVPAAHPLLRDQSHAA